MPKSQKKRLKFGYAYFGFLSDIKTEYGVEVSTPDGNAAYSWSILWEAQQRGWDTYLLHNDRDQNPYTLYGSACFSSFSKNKRLSAYLNSYKTMGCNGDVIIPLDALGDLDVILIEWRWPINGRNTPSDKDKPWYYNDLERQRELLEYFKDKKTKVIFWDLDHKLEEKDEVYWEPDAIFETSFIPRKLDKKRIQVYPPTVVKDLLNYNTNLQSSSRKAVYIGSRYERDDVIEEWIKPISEEFPFEVEFWGNWTKEPNISECREKWPLILYNERVAMEDFYRVYNTATCVPLLAKRSYMETGFLTPRPAEALTFGSLPVGLKGHFGIEKVTPLVALNPSDLIELSWELSEISLSKRDAIRKNCVEMMEPFDVKYFVDTIESIVI